MKIYNVIECVYDCSEAFCHDGDPVIRIYSCKTRKSANTMVDKIVNNYEANTYEDGEPREAYDCERTENGAVCFSNTFMVEAVITIEETELN